MWRWALAGLLTAFGILAVFSIGLPFFVAGLLLAGVLAARGRTAGAAPGLALGVGAACVYLVVAGFVDAVPLVAIASMVWVAAAAAVGLAAGRARRFRSRRA